MVLTYLAYRHLDNSACFTREQTALQMQSSICIVAGRSDNHIKNRVPRFTLREKATFCRINTIAYTPLDPNCAERVQVYEERHPMHWWIEKPRRVMGCRASPL
jgi:hypothetical protein